MNVNVRSLLLQYIENVDVLKLLVPNFSSYVLSRLHSKCILSNNTIHSYSIGDTTYLFIRIPMRPVEYKNNESWEIKVYRNYQYDNGLLPAHILYNSLFNTCDLSWYRQGTRHRKHGPARAIYCDGHLIHQCFMHNGELHRVKHPAIITKWTNLRLKHVIWYYRGKIHRDRGPAVMWYDMLGNLVLKVWYKHGKRHRKHGPALIDCRGYDYDYEYSDYYINHHNYVYTKNNTKIIAWYDNDRLHCQDYPAYYQIQDQIIYQCYYSHGLKHRLDGPAENTKTQTLRFILDYEIDSSLHIQRQVSHFETIQHVADIIKDWTTFDIYSFQDVQTNNKIQVLTYANWCLLIIYVDTSYYIINLYKNCLLHREDGPARVMYYYNNLREYVKIVQEWYIDGQFHRNSGPAVIVDFLNEEEYSICQKYNLVNTYGRHLVKKWYQYGQYHREDGPAVIIDGGDIQHWYANGKLHRDGDLPADIRYSQGFLVESRWYQHGILHRIGQPAYMQFGTDGALIEYEYFENGILHRYDGPCTKDATTQYWRIRGLLHGKPGIQNHINWYTSNVNYYYDYPYYKIGPLAKYPEEEKILKLLI